MKKSTFINLFIACCLLLGISMKAQSCYVNFTYTLGANGTVYFSGTTVPSGTTTYAYWYFPGSTTPSGPQGYGATTASATYTANGSYVVMFGMSSTSPITCSLNTTQTITITNATVTPPTCTLQVNYTPATSSVTCNGSATVATNPNMCGPATYTWSNGSTSASIYSLCPGTYSVVAYTPSTGTNCCTWAWGAVTIPTGTITPPPCSLNASFYDTQSANGGVNFINTSSGTTGSTTYTWNFGDGNTSTSTSPSHTYSANGNYTVSLIANNNGTITCVDSYYTIIYVNSYCNLLASFNYTIGANGNVSFGNTTTGTQLPPYYTMYTWNFGDGSPNSGATNPGHTFATGTYTVLLTATNFSTPVTCTSSASQVITITNPCSVTASFTHTNAGGGVVNFNSTSTGTGANTGYDWYFGDGNYLNGTSNTSPSHTYNYAGVYTVILFVTDSTNSPACTDSIAQTFTVTGPPCVANASFSLSPSGTPLYWNAYLLNPAGVIGGTWYWGDGSTSNVLFTSHTYSAAGTYDLCLTVTVSCGAANYYCATYSIYRSTQDMNMIYVNVVDPNSPTAIKQNETEELNYHIAPNPNTGDFSLSLNGLKPGHVTVGVYNLVGELIYSTDSEASGGTLNKDIHLNQVSSGVYFIKVSSNNQVFTKKMIINRQ